MPLLTAPLESVDAYVAAFSGQTLPVLRATARSLTTLSAERDRVNGKQLSALVLSDPLLTLKLLSHLETNRRHSQNHDITTIDRAIMMMGVEPFLNTFADLPTVEDALAGQPKALLGVVQLIARTRRAAQIARDWAILRHDLDVEEITVAALLGEATEIVCWLFAPDLTQRVYELQRADRSLRGAAAQARVFGASAHDIQLALVRAWHLPRLLIALLDDRELANPRVRNITLAADLARHSTRGWDNPALPDDLMAAEDLLHIGRRQLLQRLGVPAEDQARFLPPGPGPDAA
jgi:HD-like signal output (HDOD) protein